MTERKKDHDDDAPTDGAVGKRPIPNQAPISRTKVKTTDDFYTIVGRLVCEAKAEGIRPAVLACFWADSQPARRAYRAMSRLPLENDVIETWTLPHAIMMLRRHAGLAGIAFANLLEGYGDKAGEWLLEFNEPYLSASAYDNKKSQILEIFLPYRTIMNVVCFDCRRNAAGRGAVHCHLPNGEQTIICGRNPKEANEIVRLCWVATTRCLPYVGMETGPALRLRDEDLARMLAENYGRKPYVVAEVIRALRKVPGAVDCWISDVLYGSQKLSVLAQAVTCELHGVAENSEDNDATEEPGLD